MIEGGGADGDEHHHDSLYIHARAAGDAEVIGDGREDGHGPYCCKVGDHGGRQNQQEGEDQEALAWRTGPITWLIQAVMPVSALEMAEEMVRAPTSRKIRIPVDGAEHVAQSAALFEVDKDQAQHEEGGDAGGIDFIEQDGQREVRGQDAGQQHRHNVADEVDEDEALIGSAFSPTMEASSS